MTKLSKGKSLSDSTEEYVISTTPSSGSAVSLNSSDEASVKLTSSIGNSRSSPPKLSHSQSLNNMSPRATQRRPSSFAPLPQIKQIYDEEETFDPSPIRNLNRSVSHETQRLSVTIPTHVPQQQQPVHYPQSQAQPQPHYPPQPHNQVHPPQPTSFPSQPLPHHQHTQSQPTPSTPTSQPWTIPWELSAAVQESLGGSAWESAGTVVVEFTWREKQHSITAYFDLSISQKHLAGNPSAFKFLALLHRLMLEGFPKIIPMSNEKLPMIEKVSSLHQQYGTEIGNLTCQYAGLLVKKIKFHQLHPEYEGNMSLDIFFASLERKGMKASLDHEVFSKTTLMRMMSVLYDALNLKTAILKSKEDIKMVKSILQPLVVEVYNLFLVISLGLERLSSVEDLSKHEGLVDMYSSLFREVTVFGAQCAQMGYLMPNLPQVCPVFDGTVGSLAIPAPQSVTLLRSVQQQHSQPSSTPLIHPSQPQPLLPQPQPLLPQPQVQVLQPQPPTSLTHSFPLSSSSQQQTQQALFDPFTTAVSLSEDTFNPFTVTAQKQPFFNPFETQQQTLDQNVHVHAPPPSFVPSKTSFVAPTPFTTPKTTPGTTPTDRSPTGSPPKSRISVAFGPTLIAPPTTHRRTPSAHVPRNLNFSTPVPPPSSLTSSPADEDQQHVTPIDLPKQKTSQFQTHRRAYSQDPSGLLKGGKYPPLGNSPLFFGFSASTSATPEPQNNDASEEDFSTSSSLIAPPPSKPSSRHRRDSSINS